MFNKQPKNITNHYHNVFRSTTEIDYDKCTGDVSAQGTVLCVRQFQQLKPNIHTKSRWGIHTPPADFFVKITNILSQIVIFLRCKYYKNIIIKVIKMKKAKK